MKSFYSDRPPESFWRSGVAEQAIESAPGLYRKRFKIRRRSRIATAGSCFAQHIAVHLKRHGYQVMDEEPPPRHLPTDVAKTFGYELYSARYGNIYTVRQLLQLVLEVSGRFEPAEAIWTKDGRYYDALRPNVEPQGLASAEEVRLQRRDHLTSVRRLLDKADLLIFTLGLTEAWIHTESGTVYPTAPGTIAGEYDPDIFSFKNLTFDETHGDFVRLRRILKKRNPDPRFLLTVSPVPLTATASTQHVLPATIYSKSVLRAVAGQLYDTFEDVDYFPSYEIVATPFSRRLLYDDNLRTVLPEGVETVMGVFFREHGSVEGARPARKVVEDSEDDGVICEEVLLDAFARA